MQPTPARSTENNGTVTPVLTVDLETLDNTGSDEGENEKNNLEAITEPLEPEEAKEFQNFFVSVYDKHFL